MPRHVPLRGFAKVAEWVLAPAKQALQDVAASCESDEQ